MNSLLKSLLVVAALTISFSPLTSKAEVFFVEDQGNRFSLSFPDTWKKTNNQKPDDKLVVEGQGHYHFATCHVRVREDRRFVIYPEKFNDEIQRTSFSEEFWDNYLSDYDEAKIEDFRDDAGLGFGAASIAEASFYTNEGPVVHKRGLMLASLYHDQLYIIECSSQISVYDKWRDAFMGIIKSVDFKKVTHDSKSGYYREFMDDPEVEVNGPKALDVHKF